MALAAINRSFGELGIKLSLPSLLHQQLRFRNRPNLKRPLPMHFQRKRVLTVCTPVLPPKPNICENMTEIPPGKIPILENPYALFLAGQLRRDFAKYPMVAIFHFVSYSQAELIKVKIMLHHANFPMKIQQFLNVKMAQESLKGTRWAPALPLLISKTALGFCDSTDATKLNKVLKKMPMFTLIGLVYEDRLLHRNDFDKLASMSNNILGQYSQLTGTLSGPTMALSQSLIAGQSALVNSLSTYAKSLGESGDQSSSSSSSSDSSDSSSSDSDSDNEENKKK